MTKALLIDISECAGCGACSEACKEANDLPGEVGEIRDANNFTVLRDEGDDVYVRELCMHCMEPACQSVCPVKALHKTKEGPVSYDFSLCIGCRYCMVACPFDVPKYEWSKPVPRVRKCTMCYETRIKKGLPTACTTGCEENGAAATLFGERDELIKEARSRIAGNPDMYYNRIYGEDIVGGTGVMFIGPKEFGAMHFKTDLPNTPLPDLTWEVLEKIPVIVPVWATALTGLWWMYNRKLEVQEAEGPPAKRRGMFGKKGGRK